MNNVEDGELERRLAALLAGRAALAPDAAPVGAAAERALVARRRRHRRAGAGVVLGLAGLAVVSVPFAGGLAQSVLSPSEPPAPSLPAAPSPASPSSAQTSPTTSLIPWSVPADAATLATAVPSSAVPWDQDDVDAFLDAGYSYDDALALAALWLHPGDATYAKVTGGAKLRAGDQLPLGVGSGTAQVAASRSALEAFTRAGLTVDDALVLARLWQLPSGYQAAVTAGEDLAAGEPLPSTADPGGTADGGQDTAARQAWASAGHDQADAEQLALLWSLPGADDAELAGGSNLVAGQPLPLEP